MKKKSLYAVLCCIIGSLSLFSCRNLVNGFEKRTSLTIMLPYGSERAAVTKSYNFRITFTHESGTETVLEGKSGNAVSLVPAEPGEYVVSGEAFNDKNEVIFKGETKATVVDGEETVVTLTMKRQMYEVEAQSEHMKLFPDKQGIRIVLNAVEGDGDWGVKNFRLIEKDTGIQFEMHGFPTEKEPVVLYYPFTEKGKSYSFELSHKEGLKEVTETAACSAGGGEGDCFDFTDYLRTKIILDSSAAGKDTMKLSYDVTRAVKAEKIAENKFLDVGIIYSVYSGKSDWKDTAYVGTDILTKYSNEGFELNYDPILTGLSLTERFIDNVHVDLEELKNRYNWFATVALRFRMTDLPEQDFVTPDIVSENYVYKKTRKAESEHMKFEYDAKGIKVTFNYLPGDGNWNTDYYLESGDGKYSLNFVENTPPTAANPTVTYYLALTEQDKFYEYNFVMKNGGTVATEKLGCVAGGGNAGAVNIPDSWDGYEFRLGDDYGDMRLCNLNDIGINVFNYSDDSQFLNDYEYFIYNVEVYAGEYNAPNRLSVYENKHKALYISDFNMDELLPLFSDSDAIRFDNKASEDIFGARTKWSTKMIFNIGIKDTDTVLTIRELLFEDNYTGEAKPEFIQSTVEIDAANGWSLYYSCPETKLPEYEVISTSANGITIRVTGMESDFEETKKFVFQLRLKVVPEITGTRSYGYEGNYICDEEGQLYYEMYDSNMKLISTKGPISAPAGTNLGMMSAEFYPVQGNTYYYGISIMKPGTYTISDIQLW